MRPAQRTLAAILAWGVAMAAPSQAEPGDAKVTPKPGKEKPRLSLVVDRAVGFSPVTVLFTGHLTGVDPRDPNFCHAAVTWVRIDPGQSEEEGYRVREDPACLHPKEEISVPTSFTKGFTMTVPGSYLIRLIVEAKDGTRVESAYSRVQVLSNQ